VCLYSLFEVFLITQVAQKKSSRRRGRKYSSIKDWIRD
jgi:hypothetical protein